MLLTASRLTLTIIILLGIAHYSVWAKKPSTKDLLLIPYNENPEVELDLRMQKKIGGGQQFRLAEEKDLTLGFGEFVTFSMTASQSGYVSLWHIDSKGAIQRLFPNQYQPNMKVEAGKRYILGGNRSQFFIEGVAPEGMDNIYMVWTKKQEQQPIPSSPKDLLIVQQAPPSHHISELGRLLKLDDKHWVTTHLAFETSANGLPLYPSNAITDKGLERLRMTGLKKASRIHVLSMGANTRGLSKADYDAKEFLKTVKHLFSHYRVGAKLYPKATVKQFRTGMDWLTQQSRPNDWVIIFFSGHGSTITDQSGDEKDKRDEVFVMTDVNGEEFMDDSLVMVDDEFAERIKGINSNNIIVVIDACHAGGLTKRFSLGQRRKFFRKGKIGAHPASKEDAIKGGIDFNKGVAIFATSEQQQALETQRGGLLTTYLLDEMKNDKNIGSNWYDIIKRAHKNVQRSSKVRPYIMGNTRLLQTIKMTE